MTTALDLTWRVKRLIEQNERVEQNTLDGAYTAGGTSLVLAEAMRGIVVDAELEVDAELFRVVSVSGQVATVKGAQRGTTAANHADLSNVFVNPRFSTVGIIDDLNNSLSDMETAGLFKETALNITFNPEVSGYDLAGSSTVLDVLEVRYEETAPSKRFPPIRSFSLLRNMDTSDFASGNALVIDRPAFPGLPLRVRYGAPFTRIAALTDSIESTVGLTSSMLDLPVLGAAIRQMEGRDTRRSFLETQRDTRRTNEVPVGASQNAISTLRRKFEERLGEERMRLVQRYPYMSRR